MSRSRLYGRLNAVKFRNYLRKLDAESKQAAKEAMKESLKELSEEILRQVPRDTNTLVNSYSFKIVDEGDQVTAKFGFALTKDPVNPKTGLRASQYMLAVHEDLSARHPNGGKAKFLEDPIRDFQAEFYRKATVSIVQKLKGVKK